MLLISRSMDLRKIFISSLCSIDKLCFHLFGSSVSAFSSQYLLLFLKSSESSVLLPTPFTSVICPLMASWRRQFIFRIWSIHLAFLCRILFRSVLFSPVCSRTCLLVTFLPFYLLHSLLPYFKAFQILPLQFS